MKTFMHRLLAAALILSLLSCNRSTCPTFDSDAGEKSMKGGQKTKTAQGLFPKNVKKK